MKASHIVTMLALVACVMLIGSNDLQVKIIDVQVGCVETEDIKKGPE